MAKQEGEKTEKNTKVVMSYCLKTKALAEQFFNGVTWECKGCGDTDYVEYTDAVSNASLRNQGK